MSAIRNKIVPLPFDPPETQPSVALRGALNRLRFLAAGCRATARLDLFRARDFLDPDNTIVAHASATAVVRTLDQAIGAKAILFPPGTPETSFDESWLLRLVERCCMRDIDSVDFLLKCRVRFERRRAFLYLVQTLADNIETFQES